MSDEHHTEYERAIYRAAKLSAYLATHGKYEQARIVMQMGAEVPQE